MSPPEAGGGRSADYNTEYRSGDRQIATPLTHPLGPVTTDYSWTPPAGLPMRNVDHEYLLIFRRAVGINSDRGLACESTDNLESGRLRAVGIYRSIIRNQRRRRFAHHVFGVMLYACHFLQIILAAILTAMGPNAKEHEIAITILGATNTVTAGVLAVLKGSGAIERLAKDEVEFKKLQDWIEETESLVSVGIIGRDRKEVGVLVEVAFKKYNACFGRAYELMSSSDIVGSPSTIAKNPKLGGR